MLEHCLEIIGAFFAILVLILKPSDKDIALLTTEYPTVYATELSSADDPIEEYQSLFIFFSILAIALSVHSWIIIFTLYQEYTYFQFAALRGGPFAVAANRSRRSVATIESELALHEHRSMFGGVR